MTAGKCRQVDRQPRAITPHHTEGDRGGMERCFFAFPQTHDPFFYLVLLSSKRAAICELGLPSRWLAEYRRTANTRHHSLGVGEHCGDLETTWTLDIHEV